MKKTIALGLLVTFAAVSAASAMTVTNTDTMMKKEDTMMKVEVMNKTTDTMMKKEDAMMASKDAGMGSRGEHVKSLQAFLISKGFLTTSSTGYFGPATKKAVMKYQKSVGVTETGYYGAKTRKAMDTGMMMKKDDAMMKGDTMMKDKMTQ